jgi:phosphatidylcholine synthase
VPVKYLYPSRTPTLWTLNMVLATVWLASYAVITATLPDPAVLAVTVSLA